MDALLDYKKLETLADVYHLTYTTNDPFPHMVFDNFANPEVLSEALKYFPAPSDIQWFAYKNALEVKLAQNKLNQIPTPLKHVLWELNSGPFIDFLEKLTGIEGLIVDADFVGGGLHQIQTGGKLQIHADFNFHKKLKLDRRINAILYMNQEWDESYGGHLELWDKDMTECKKKILPIFNRLVVFNTTDWSYHGHPDPLTCPEDMTRKSIALYYYSNGRPSDEKSDSHSTLYQLRPQDDQQLKELAAKRARGRLEDNVLNQKDPQSV